MEPNISVENTDVRPGILLSTPLSPSLLSCPTPLVSRLIVACRRPLCPPADQTFTGDFDFSSLNRSTKRDTHRLTPTPPPPLLGLSPPLTSFKSPDLAFLLGPPALELLRKFTGVFIPSSARIPDYSGSNEPEAFPHPSPTSAHPVSSLLPPPFYHPPLSPQTDNRLGINQPFDTIKVRLQTQDVPAAAAAGLSPSQQPKAMGATACAVEMMSKEGEQQSLKKCLCFRYLRSK